METELDKFGRPYPPKSGAYYIPSIATDSIVTRFSEQDPSKLEILLITRGGNPFKGCLALPGGFVDYNEDPKIGALRELKEETNLEGEIKSLVGVFGEPDRDPRRHVISIAYHIHVNNETTLKAGDDAKDAKFYDLTEILARGESALAFDHHKIIQTFLTQIS